MQLHFIYCHAGVVIGDSTSVVVFVTAHERPECMKTAEKKTAKNNFVNIRYFCIILQ